jgi:hypothetical protein
MHQTKIHRKWAIIGARKRARVEKIKERYLH